MDDRRHCARRRVLKAAVIEFNRAGGISCTVRNVSERGACLGVASPLGIPDEFDLVVESDRLRHTCHVAWRSEKQIGVAFVA
jgi:PilZ domain